MQQKMKNITLYLSYINTEYRSVKFELEINIEKYPKANSLNKGSKIKMGDFGTPNSTNFFESELFPYKYDCWEDHYLYQVDSIKVS